METNKNYLEKLSLSIKKSVTLKLLSIFVLMMLLMIPMSYVQSLIHEREMLRQQAISEVSNKWANEQYVYGPVLSIPIQKQVQDGEEVKVINEYAHILPSNLEVKGNLTSRSLWRGIYEVVVYDSKLSFSGKFDKLSTYLSELKEYEVFEEEAFLSINISDLRGVKEKVQVKWDAEHKDVEPGSTIAPLIASGLTVNNVLDSNDHNSHQFSFDLKLQGSQYIGFVPLGKETRVNLVSNWKDPSFSGAFLPENRELGEDGFTAEWKVLELNRNYPQFWIGERHIQEIQKSSFGVDLLLPTNDYHKAMRSAKYALLAISLTFLTFFLVEIFNKSKVHPFQYVLIGLALCLFYTLLVSISEHSNFNIAYAISSVVIIGMIGLYTRSILHNLKQTLVLTLILCFTYAFVYVTLQVQDYALLIGSIGLTSILAFTMYITRNVNWYELSAPKETEGDK